MQICIPRIVWKILEATERVYKGCARSVPGRFRYLVSLSYALDNKSTQVSRHSRALGKSSQTTHWPRRSEFGHRLMALGVTTKSGARRARPLVLRVLLSYTRDSMSTLGVKTKSGTGQVEPECSLACGTEPRWAPVKGPRRQD